MATQPSPPSPRAPLRGEAWSADDWAPEPQGKRMLTTQDLLALEGLRRSSGGHVRWFATERR